MSLFLLDTTLASALLPWRASSPLRLLYADIFAQAPYAVALQTEAEVWQGAEEAGWGEFRRQKIVELLDRMLVLLPDRSTARLWGKLRAVSKAQGCLLSPADAWIAAAAVQHGLELATHDKDLGRLAFPDLRVTCRAPP